MSVKEDWRRVQTVSDETLEENWKLMFGDKGQIIDTQAPIKSYSGEAVLTIPEEDRVCEWQEDIEPAKEVVGMISVSYNASCGDSMVRSLYSYKVEAILKKATYCMFCGKKVKWKN